MVQVNQEVLLYHLYQVGRGHLALLSAQVLPKPVLGDVIYDKLEASSIRLSIHLNKTPWYEVMEESTLEQKDRFRERSQIYHEICTLTRSKTD